VPPAKRPEPADISVDSNSSNSLEAPIQMVVSPQGSSPQPKASEWREQLNSKLDGIREKNSETQPAAPELLNDIRNREFARTAKEGPGSNQEDLFQSKAEYHPLAERVLEKLERSKLSKPAMVEPPLWVEQNQQAQPRESLPKSQVRRVKRRSHPEKIERIEINLDQGSLPFDNLSSNNHTWEDRIQKGLVAAPLAARIRAGAIDGLFICGCFLIFLMIIFFIPDFAFFSKSAFLGLAIAGALIANTYLFFLTVLSARTLGMDHEHLQVINFEGKVPSLRETSLRSFGYFISLGCFCLGFLWAIFDSDNLTWHDRISKTLIMRKDAFKPEFQG